jgi:L-aspartate oxidase
VPGAPRYLLSEALRGEGARLINHDGEAFMPAYEPDGDLAPRDRVARAMLREAERTRGEEYLSLRHLPAAMVHARFPSIAELCRRAGLDLATDRLPVSPAAHYLMGGVASDLDGRASLPGLFVAGEAACTGVHGANRLASNSLLEGLVFGARAGRAMREWTREAWPRDSTSALETVAPTGPRLDLGTEEAVLRDLMWRHAGVFRAAAGLDAATEALDPAWRRLEAGLAGGHAFDPATWRMTSLLVVSRLVVAAARRREESRGAHSRTDFPETDDIHWNRHATDVR